MYCFNSRSLVPYLINTLKIFQVGGGGGGILGKDWDPYNIMGDLSWIKAFALLLLLFAFSFISIEFKAPGGSVGVDPSGLNPPFLRLSLSGNYFSISMPLSLLVSLLFPQKLFWFVNPVINILSSSFCCSTRRHLIDLLVRLHAAASRLPGYTILIVATHPGSEDSEEDGDLRDQHQQVVVTIDTT